MKKVFLIISLFLLLCSFTLGASRAPASLIVRLPRELSSIEEVVEKLIYRELSWRIDFTSPLGADFIVEFLVSEVQQEQFAPSLLYRVPVSISYEENTVKRTLLFLVSEKTPFEKAFAQEFSRYINDVIHELLEPIDVEKPYISYVTPYIFSSYRLHDDLRLGGRYWVLDYDFQKIGLAQLWERRENVLSFRHIWATELFKEGMIIDTHGPQYEFFVGPFFSMEKWGFDIGVSFPLSGSPLRLVSKLSYAYAPLSSDMEFTLSAGGSLGIALFPISGNWWNSVQFELQSLCCIGLQREADNTIHIITGAQIGGTIGWQFSPTMRISCGVGYRFIASSVHSDGRMIISPSFTLLW